MPAMSWIIPKLAVGGAEATSEPSRLARVHGIRRVVDLRAEASVDATRFASSGLRLLWLPIPDHHALALEKLDQGVTWVLEGLENHEAALVHCQHGIGRSVLLASCVLVARGFTALEAIRIIKLARPIASPSPAQLSALLEWTHRESARSGRPSVQETWDDLAHVAYSHPGPRSG